MSVTPGYSFTGAVDLEDVRIFMSPYSGHVRKDAASVKKAISKISQ